MKRSNRLVILVGVLLAVLAFVGIVILLNQRPSGPAVAETPKTTVLVANQDIAIGDEVTPETVTAQEVDPAAVDGTALADPSQLRNRTALVAIPEGAQVNAETFGQIGNQRIDITGQLRPGEKAIALQVDRVTGIDFLVKQGDLVDLIISQQISVLQPTADSAQAPDAPQRFEVVAGLTDVRTVKTVLQSKRVLYVSDTRIQAEEAPEPSPDAATTPAQQPPVIERVIIVFAGTDVDAELIKFAQRDSGEIGAFSVTLRNPEDEAVEETEGMTLDALVERYSLPIPNIVTDLEEGGTP